MSEATINSFGSCLNEFLFYQHIFSISTFTCESNGVHEFKLKNSTFLRIAKFLTFILYNFVFVVSILSVEFPNQKIVFREIKYRAENYDFFGYTEMGMTVFCSHVVTIVLELHNESHKELLTTLNSIDHDLIVYFHVNFDYSAFARWRLFNVAIAICQLLIVPTIYFWHFIESRYDGIPFVALYALGNNIESCDRFTFGIYTRLVRERLKIVDEKLREISLHCNDDGSLPEETRAKNITDLDVLFGCHRKLCRTVHLINKVFGMTNLTSIVHDFTLLSSQLFIIYLVIDSGKGIIKWDVLLPILSMVYPNIMRLVLTSMSSGITTSRVCETIHHERRYSAGIIKKAEFIMVNPEFVYLIAFLIITAV